MTEEPNGSWLNRLIGGLSPALLAIVAVVLGLLLYLHRQDAARERLLTELVQGCVPHGDHSN